MPPQKIIIRSQGSNKHSNSSKSFNQTQSKVFEKLVQHQRYEDEQNQQYLDHVGGLCLCTLCNCGRHHCNGRNCLHKPNVRLNKSTYQQEFIPKTPDMSQLYNKNLYLNPKQEGEIKRVTTYKHDYPGYIQNLHIQEGPKSITTGLGSFSGLSTYKNMFRNWGVGGTPDLMPQNNPTVIQNLPFAGRSNYREQFQPFHVEPAQSTKGLYCHKSPLSPPDIKFTGTSIAKSSFVPLHTERIPSNQKLQLVPLNPSYKGQYNTIYGREYDSKMPHPCPAKEVLDEVEQLSKH